MKTNWQDGGGFYAPGSDTPDAPWNQKDIEPTEEHVQQATNEVWFLLKWSNNENPDISVSAINDMLQTVLPLAFWREHNFELITEQMEITEEDHGTTAALSIMPKELRHPIKLFTECWIEERAIEIAQEDID